MGTLSKSIHSWYQSNDVEVPKDLVMCCPVSMKTLPKSVKDINLNNYTSSVTIRFPVLENLGEALKITKKRFSKFFKFFHLLPTIYMLKLFRFIPHGIGRHMISQFLNEIDFLLTNVNGPREPIYLCNKKIRKSVNFLLLSFL